MVPVLAPRLTTEYAYGAAESPPPGSARTAREGGTRDVRDRGTVCDGRRGTRGSLRRGLVPPGRRRDGDDRHVPGRRRVDDDRRRAGGGLAAGAVRGPVRRRRDVYLAATARQPVGPADRRGRLPVRPDVAQRVDELGHLPARPAPLLRVFGVPRLRHPLLPARPSGGKSRA